MRSVADGSGSEQSQDKIELRSEKVQEILGSIPNRLVRWGIAIICVIFVLLIAAVMCIDYPYGHGETIFEHVFIE